MRSSMWSGFSGRNVTTLLETKNMDLLTRIEASLEFMNDGGPIGDRVDFVNLREVLEGSREALLKLDRLRSERDLAIKQRDDLRRRVRSLEIEVSQERRIRDDELSQRQEAEAKLDSAANAMREVVSHLQHSQRGSTHWAGCPDVHPVCQAIDMLVDALPLRDVETPVTEQCGRGDRRSDS